MGNVPHAMVSGRNGVLRSFSCCAKKIPGETRSRLRHARGILSCMLLAVTYATAADNSFSQERHGRITQTCPGRKIVPAFFSSTGSEGQSQSQRELRRVIEERVLRAIESGILEHSEKVARGERQARPFVTLTYAQTIDGSIAAANKSQVKGSAPEEAEFDLWNGMTRQSTRLGRR